jgi:hypothetical protein
MAVARMSVLLGFEPLDKRMCIVAPILFCLACAGKERFAATLQHELDEGKLVGDMVKGLIKNPKWEEMEKKIKEFEEKEKAEEEKIKEEIKKRMEEVWIVLCLAALFAGGCRISTSAIKKRVVFFGAVRAFF